MPSITGETMAAVQIAMENACIGTTGGARDEQGPSNNTRSSAPPPFQHNDSVVTQDFDAMLERFSKKEEALFPRKGKLNVDTFKKNGDEYYKKHHIADDFRLEMGGVPAKRGAVPPVVLKTAATFENNHFCMGPATGRIFSVVGEQARLEAERNGYIPVKVDHFTDPTQIPPREQSEEHTTFDPLTAPMPSGLKIPQNLVAGKLPALFKIVTEQESEGSNKKKKIEEPYSDQLKRAWEERCIIDGTVYSPYKSWPKEFEKKCKVPGTRRSAQYIAIKKCPDAPPTANALYTRAVAWKKEKEKEDNAYVGISWFDLAVQCANESTSREG